MRTYEGTFIIKWYKNDNGDRRPITIDCEDMAALRREQVRIRHEFMTEGDDPAYQFYHGAGLPHSITFDMHERK
jgi:hypothetical protein